MKKIDCTINKPRGDFIDVSIKYDGIDILKKRVRGLEEAEEAFKIVRDKLK